MLIYIAIYLLTICLVFITLKAKRNKVFDLPELNFEQDKICFFSKRKHKIKCENCSVLAIGDKAFLKSGKRKICIQNITDVFLKKDYLFFKACGSVEILFGKNKLFRYLQLNICSKDFDLSSLKRQAELEVVNNLFDLRNCKQLKRFLRFVVKVLKINAQGEKLIVKQNNYNFSYSVDYFCKNVKKRILFN